MKEEASKNGMDIYAKLEDIGKKAKQASQFLAKAGAKQKTDALYALARLLREKQTEILDANSRDVEQGKARSLDAPRLARLTLTPEIIEEMAEACIFVADYPDPLGATETQWQRPNGLLVGKMRVPLGVVAMIFESRPNVVIDSAILCLKAGNSVIMRGGSEAIHSNLALGAVLHKALVEAGLPADCAQVVDVTDREAIRAMCKLSDYIDVIIPRGGEPLIRMVSQEAAMPVLKHDKGVCHLFVDEGADLDAALSIAFNGKVQRPSACNALECLLVHKSEAQAFLPRLAEELGRAGVSFRACPDALNLFKNCPEAKVAPMTDADKGKEYLDLILGVRVVDGLAEALDYISKYGSQHTEVICTNNHEHAMAFLREVDASMVAVNASSRFNDGGQLGLGAEIGISTSKLHAYGPMGIKELTTTKFVVLGNGQVRG